MNDNDMFKDKEVIAKKAQISFGAASFDGLKFAVFNTGHHIQSFWSFGAYYEAGLIAFIQKNYKGGTIIDIGASIGNHTMAFSKIADHVYSIEPYNKFFHHLCFNLIINDLKNVTPLNIALGDTTGSVNLGQVKEEVECAGVHDTGEPAIIIPLDTLHLENITLIKVDVEQYEEKVLRGATDTIQRCKPDIIIECADKEEFNKTLKLLHEIEPEYKVFYKQVFNVTPTFIFTTNNLDDYETINEEEYLCYKAPVHYKIIEEDEVPKNEL